MKTAPLHYRIAPLNLHAHLFEITLTVAQPQPSQTVSLPAWIPGSYMIREFARHLQRLTASQQGRSVQIQQIDKATWQVECQADQPLVLRYEVYAFDTSVRTAWLDAQRGFFNPTSLCLMVRGQEGQPHTVQLTPPAPPQSKTWRVATALAPVQTNARGFGTYRAADYDELADSPVELGDFWEGEFMACGIPHRLVVAGAPPTLDAARLLADTQKICETAIRFWHPTATQRAHVPHAHYVFMLNTVADGYGGLEHRASTALICSRKDLPRVGDARATEGYITLLGLISHEYFHTWNVKRLRPAEFTRYDYSRENYTQLLWFFEGFTSYYDDLLLRRAGLIDDATYLKLLSKTWQQVLQTPGRHLQSVAEASFDAWMKYYRQDENTPNATVSYYTKGALVALCLDLTLRAHGQSLDDILRALWARTQGGPMTEADVMEILRQSKVPGLEHSLQQWVHGTDDLPVRALLESQGVACVEENAPIAQRLGLRATEQGGIHLKVVLRGSAAETAGMAAGDEWLGIEVQGESWRLHQLTELECYAPPGAAVLALIARDRRLLKLPLSIPAASMPRLSMADADVSPAWLTGRPHPGRADRRTNKPGKRSRA